jgi:hypothetical protein
MKPAQYAIDEIAPPVNFAEKHPANKLVTV